MYKFIIKSLNSDLKRKLRKVNFLNKLNNYLRKKLRPDFIITKEDKHIIFLDKLDSLHLSINGLFEPFQNEIVKKYIKKGDIVLDLGANIGYYSLLLAKLVGEDGKVYSFEPEPSNFALLKKNIKINNYKNIIPINKAVSNKDGKIKLYLNEKDFGMHSTSDFYKDSKSIEVESISLDSFFKDKDKKVDFIKIDIEGAEGKAIKGMQGILKENGNIKILSEFNFLWSKKCGMNLKECFNILKDFKIYRILELKKEIIPESVKEIEKGFNKDIGGIFLFIKNKIEK